MTSFVTCVFAFASDQVLPEAEVRQLRGGARPVAVYHACREPASQGKEEAFEVELDPLCILRMSIRPSVVTVFIGQPVPKYLLGRLGPHQIDLVLISFDRSFLFTGHDRSQNPYLFGNPG